METQLSMQADWERATSIPSGSLNISQDLSEKGGHWHTGPQKQLEQAFPDFHMKADIWGLRNGEQERRTHPLPVHGAIF